MFAQTALPLADALVCLFMCCGTCCNLRAPSSHARQASHGRIILAKLLFLLHVHSSLIVRAG